MQYPALFKDRSTDPDPSGLAGMVELARQAFDADFDVVATDSRGRLTSRAGLLQLMQADQSRAAGNSRWSQPSPATGVRLIPIGERRTVVMIPTLNELGERRFLTGIVHDSPSPALHRLAATVELAIQQQEQLLTQRKQLDDYADQVCRDFEELVWMRSLAEQIEQTDIREPLGRMAAALFPPLIDMIQTQELVLVQDRLESGSASTRDIIRVGRSGVSDETVFNVIDTFAGPHPAGPIVVNHQDECAAVDPSSNLRQFILVPIDKQHELFGWLLAINRPDSFLPGRPRQGQDPCSEQEFGTFEAGLLDSAASFLASHAKNTSLFAEQEQLLKGIVRSMINVIDAKDPYTCGHSDRVAVMSRLIARELSLSPVECEQIFLTGLLHDVGKIGIPDRVLQKSDRLTDEEFDLIKQHPVIGYNVLKHLDQISYVLPGVLHHHEAFDGGGYPHGLRGEAIPLSARILAVADSFDAMTSNRPYRVGMPYVKAEFILRRKSGIQWDGNVVEVFLRIRGEMHEVCRNNDAHLREMLNPQNSDAIMTALAATSRK